MVQAYFVSDIHIQNLSDSRAKVFLSFLKDSVGLRALPHSPPAPLRDSSAQVELLRLSLQAEGPLAAKRQMTHLFLVGDIFDLWIADHQYFANAYKPLIDELVRLKNEGVEICYFEGNHDLYLREFWQEHLGFKVFADAHTFTLAGLEVRVEHGDLIDPEDRGYRFLRWLLRSPGVTWLAQNLPGQAVVAIGERASHKSRVYTSEVKTVTASEAVRKIRLHAERAAQTEKFDLLVNGHVHVFDDYTFFTDGKTRRAINLGSWLGGHAQVLSLALISR